MALLYKSKVIKDKLQTYFCHIFTGVLDSCARFLHISFVVNLSIRGKKWPPEETQRMSVIYNEM